MKLQKDSTGCYQYITEDRKFRVNNGYHSMFAMKCWIVEEYGKKDQYFKTLKEAKEYVASKYAE